MPAVVKTGDATHLASALLFAERGEPDLGFSTDDRGQATAVRALALGF
ncbi:MAG: hypothetical protein OXN89_15860 [Bryobacterales bacterium]|nr:hypothetical protein [Bryobacterales bacterium]